MHIFTPHPALLGEGWADQAVKWAKTWRALAGFGRKKDFWIIHQWIISLFQVKLSETHLFSFFTLNWRCRQLRRARASFGLCSTLWTPHDQHMNIKRLLLLQQRSCAPVPKHSDALLSAQKRLGKQSRAARCGQNISVVIGLLYAMTAMSVDTLKGPDHHFSALKKSLKACKYCGKVPNACSLHTRKQICV